MLVVHCTLFFTLADCSSSNLISEHVSITLIGRSGNIITPEQTSRKRKTQSFIAETFFTKFKNQSLNFCDLKILNMETDRKV